MKKWYAAGTLPELVDIRKEIHLDDNIYFTAYTVHGIKDRYPAGQNCSLAMHRLTGVFQAQWIQANVDFANGIICRVCIIIHESYLQWFVLQLGIIYLKSKPLEVFGD